MNRKPGDLPPGVAPLPAGSSRQSGPPVVATKNVGACVCARLAAHAPAAVVKSPANCQHEGNALQDGDETCLQES